MAVKILIAASCVSMVAFCGLLTAIGLSAFNTRKSTEKTLFVRTHVAAYFVSLLCCDLLQAIGSIMNQKWVTNQAVYVGEFCTIQGGIKQASDIGLAIFTFIIAVHTFLILFLRWHIRRYALWLTLTAAWTGIAAIVLSGPALISNNRHGPFFGIAGYWCWITKPYAVEQITLDYMFMFGSVTFSFILYTLVFLRLRGNIVLSGWYIAFRWANKSQNAIWRGRNFADNQLLMIARQMMLYPVAYTVVILPIASVRFSGYSVTVPFAATIFADTVFLLSGTINVTLFITTRRVLPPQSIIPSLFSMGPKMMETSNQPDSEANYLGESMEKTTEDSSSDIKGPDSDGGSVMSMANEHMEEPVTHE